MARHVARRCTSRRDARRRQLGGPENLGWSWVARERGAARGRRGGGEGRVKVVRAAGPGHLLGGSGSVGSDATADAQGLQRPWPLLCPQRLQLRARPPVNRQLPSETIQHRRLPRRQVSPRHRDGHTPHIHKVVVWMLRSQREPCRCTWAPRTRCGPERSTHGRSCGRPPCSWGRGAALQNGDPPSTAGTAAHDAGLVKGSGKPLSVSQEPRAPSASTEAKPQPVAPPASAAGARGPGGPREELSLGPRGGRRRAGPAVLAVQGLPVHREEQLGPKAPFRFGRRSVCGGWRGSWACAEQQNVGLLGEL